MGIDQMLFWGVGALFSTLFAFVMVRIDVEEGYFSNTWNLYRERITGKILIWFTNKGIWSTVLKLCLFLLPAFVLLFFIIGFSKPLLLFSLPSVFVGFLLSFVFVMSAGWAVFALVLRYSSPALCIAGVLIFFWQIYVFLKSGYWAGIPLMRGVGFFFGEWRIFRYLNNGEGWIGLKNICEYVLLHFPLSLSLIIGGWQLFATALRDKSAFDGFLSPENRRRGGRG